MPSLVELLGSDADVLAVVTNPDRPAGRGMKMTPSPVKQAALEAGVEVIQVARARDPELADRMRELAPDVAIVVAYGSILPAALLEIPGHGFVNLHFSLLPLYRGAAPVQRAIMNGDDTTGVSVMVLTEGMDEGPVLSSAETEIAPDDTGGSLGARLALIGAPLLVESVHAYVRGELTPVAQDDGAATYAGKVTTDEARIDWERPARRIRDHVRALQPAPGAWTTLRGSRVKVHRVTAAEGRGRLAPGVLAAEGGLFVGTADEPLHLDEVQPATKRRMSGAELARGLRLEGAERMGE